MGRQMTEMLKGTLEGIVLATLAGQSAYGYEITAGLRETGLPRYRRGHRLRAAHPDRAARPRRRGEGPSEKGPPRKVYSLNARGHEYLEEFWRTWGFLADRLEQLHEGGR